MNLKSTKIKAMVLALFSGICLLAGFGGQATASDAFPNRAITIVVPWSAGGGATLETQILAKIGAKYLGQEIAVINKPGASGSMGAVDVMKAKADGYTLFLGNGSVFIGMIQSKVPYSFNDFVPIVQTSNRYYTLTVSGQAPYKTLSEYVDQIKNNPGKITYGHNGVGGFSYTMGVMMGKAFGADLKLVPFPGGSDTSKSIMGGHVDSGAHAASTLPAYIKSGDLRCLGVIAPNRIEELPDIPTIKEQGYNIEDVLWEGIFVRKGTPDAVVNYLRENFIKITKDPNYIADMRKIKSTPHFMAGDEFGTMAEKWIERFRTEM
jgi:tripartite-type tricarboxylate transporter receptor subunit TctC